MSKSASKPPRNRSAQARDHGRVLCSFELTAEASALIDQAVAYLRDRDLASDGRGRATRVQALEWLVRTGAKKIPEKYRDGLDRDLAVG